MSKGVEIPNRLFFGGIRDFSTVSDLSSRLTSILAPLGAIASPLQPVIDTLTNELKGFAYADITSNNSSTLLDDSILTKAIKSLHGLQWRGSRLRVERAVENGLDKLSRERKEEAESERLQEETSNNVDQTNFSLPSKLRIRKRGYEPCTEVFSTPFESTETAEAIEAKRILDLPPLKMAKEIEKKTRHRAIHIKFEEGNGTDGSFRKDTNKKSNERSNMNDIDESKKHLWEIRVGRGQEGKNMLSSSSSSSTSSSTIAIDTISSNISSVGLVPISSDGHDLIRSSMLADTRRQI
jgi:RNA recognition motif-containing protein